MAHKGPYHTRQAQEVAAYLRARPGEHLTAAELCAAFAAAGAPVGKATVYRQLERLVEAGVVTRYTVDGVSGSCYAYTGPDAEAETAPCYHCKCQQCGALFHLHCDEVEQLRRHLLACHGFALDPRRTVFYGLCPACQAGH